MKYIQAYLDSISWDAVINKGVKVLVILLITLILMKGMIKLLVRLEKRLVARGRLEGEPPSESAKRVETIIRLIRQGAMLMLWATVGLVLLGEFGVSIGPLIASAGILGLAVGFGAQNLVRDVISGFFIILENQIRVGDVAILNGTGGLVERINFRTTVLRDLGGVVHVFPNGEVKTISNMTNDWSAYVFDIGVAYKEDTDRVIEIMKQVGAEMFKDEAMKALMLEEPEIFGVDKFDDSAVVIKGRVRTRPIRQWAVGREFLRRVKYAFDENGVEIPFPHRTFYFGEESKPIDLQMLEKLEKDGGANGEAGTAGAQ